LSKKGHEWQLGVNFCEHRGGESGLPALPNLNLMTLPQGLSRSLNVLRNHIKMTIKHNTVLTILSASALIGPIALANNTHVDDRSEYFAPHAEIAPSIDGQANDSAWQKAEWRELASRWLGPEYSGEDFQGRYKIVWTADKLYILGEFVDDVLFDAHRDPLVQYWDDDTLEIFIDEDHSGGDHQYNHNAFAYHVSLDNQAIDIGTDERPRNYSHHVDSVWKQQGNRIVWELAIDIYTDEYVDGSDDNRRRKLSAGEQLGLLIAYCDNDGSELRENFIGSEAVNEGAKDRGWIDAGIFGSLILIDTP
jgi:hypothetical protein